MQNMLDECDRRRKKQVAHNEAHGITPKTVARDIKEGVAGVGKATPEDQAKKAARNIKKLGITDLPKEILALRKQMQTAAENLDFETAADLRDRVRELESLEIGL